ncbi:MAG: ABC transporter permease, partial [Acidobacteriota bacterium]
MKIIWILAIKDLRLLLRDRAAFFFTFFFPVLYATFFGAIFSGSGDGGSNAISVLLVDEDQTAGSREFVALLEQAEELNVIPSDDKHQARETVRRGNRVAYIALPKGFGEARKNIFGGETPRLEIGVDPARKAESGMLQGILTKYAAQAMQQVFPDPQVMRDQLAKARQSVHNAPPALQVAL